MTQYRVRNPAEFQTACNAAEAGAEILLHGGLYDKPTKLSEKIGTRERPIVVRAADNAWLSGGQQPDPFWGGGNPADDAPRKPGTEDFALLVMDGCKHVILDGLRVRDCWPTIVFVKDSAHIVIRNCNWRHATYAIFVKGGKTTHLLVEGNFWQQDDSDRHLLWTTHDWARAHGDEQSDGLLRYFNGGFLSGKAIRGNVIVRRNQITDAYNGIRLKGDTAAPDIAKVNANIHIFDNDFVRIRDNPVEPEVSAFNWHVRHNRIVDCHSWFSFDGTAGGYWYFYGNTGQFTSRQGLSRDLPHTMGRVLKLSYEKSPRPPEPESEPVATHPWFVFNNSWHLRCPIIGGANPTVPDAGEGPDFTAHLAFINNAFQWCDPGAYGDRICEMTEVIHNYDPRRSQRVTFDYTVCNRPDYLDFMHSIASEPNGIPAKSPIFASPVDGRLDFRPAENSDALGTGWVGNLPRPPKIRPASLRVQSDGTLNRGAMQDYGPIEVPELEVEANELLRQLAPIA